jgi:uroporphyrinogen decarboxylase
MPIQRFAVLTLQPIDVIHSTLRFEEPERIPVIPLIGVYSSTITGIPIEDLLVNPRAQSNALLKSMRKFKYDGVLNVMDLTVEAQALGAEIVFPPDEFPYIVRPPLDKMEDIDDLSLENSKSSRIPVFVESTSMLSEAVGDTHLVSSYIIGPFTLAGHLLGVAKLLETTLEDMASVQSFVSSCLSILKPYLNQLVEAGAHNIVILEPTASNSVISPQYFRDYSAPYIESMISQIHSKGASATLHICGKTNQITENMCDTGADVLSIDSAVDLIGAKKEAHGQSVLLGNVDTTVLLKGTPSDVRNAAKKCIRDASRGGGFILSSGCDFPIQTPEENFVALLQAANL